MRTTIDLPDDLLRRVKARAALDGLKLKDLIARYVEQGLRQAPPVTDSNGRPPPPQPRTDPPMFPPTGHAIPALTNAEIEEILMSEDAEHLAAVYRRND